MTLDEWVQELQEALDVDAPLDVRAVLDLARDAAHNVERPAAPVTTFLAGYAAGLKGGSAKAIEAALRTASSRALAAKPTTAEDAGT